MDPNTIQAAAATPEQSAPHAPLPVPELPLRVLLDLVTDCNLKCPMCIVHGGTDDPRLKEFLKKSMTVENARKVLDEIMAVKDKAIPDKVMKNAKCIAVIPSMIKIAVGFGGNHGKGVATCRTENGSWSAPAPISSSWSRYGVRTRSHPRTSAPQARARAA